MEGQAARGRITNASGPPAHRPTTTTDDTPSGPSLTSNCSWGGLRMERQRRGEATITPGHGPNANATLWVGEQDGRRRDRKGNNDNKNNDNNDEQRQQRPGRRATSSRSHVTTTGQPTHYHDRTPRTTHHPPPTSRATARGVDGRWKEDWGNITTTEPQLVGWTGERRRREEMRTMTMAAPAPHHCEHSLAGWSGC
jgi:hypothetical protein